MVEQTHQFQPIQNIQNIPNQIQQNVMINQSIQSIPMMNYNHKKYPIQMNNYLQPEYVVMNVPQQQLTQINQVNKQKVKQDTQQLIQMRKICLQKLPKASQETLCSIAHFIDPDSFDVDIDFSELSHYQLSYILHLLDPKNYQLPVKNEENDLKFGPMMGA